MRLGDIKYTSKGTTPFLYLLFLCNTAISLGGCEGKKNIIDTQEETAQTEPQEEPDQPTETQEQPDQQTGPQEDPNQPTGPQEEPTQPISQQLSIDCTRDNPACPEIVIDGDSPNENDQFRGLADPSVRKDPTTGRWWIAYSWPHAKRENPASPVSPRTTLIETHLAYSDDDGGSWTVADSPLFPVKWADNPNTNTVDQMENYQSNETITTWVEEQNGTTTWYAVRWQYLVSPQAPYIYHQLGATSSFVVSKANTIEELSSAESTRLGFKWTPAAFGVSETLSDLAPAELNKCAIWAEPAITVVEDKLYLAAQCWAYNRLNKPVHDQYFYGVFSTDTSGPVSSWNWTYEGQLAGPSEAQELEGHTFWNQLDFSKREDGTLLGVISLADSNPDPEATADVYHGCRVIEIESLSPPKLARDSNGELIVHAKVEATDLDVVGPAACAYEPELPLGILITRRYMNDPVEFYRWSIHSTGLRP